MNESCVGVKFSQQQQEHSWTCVRDYSWFYQKSRELVRECMWFYCVQESNDNKNACVKVSMVVN